MADDNRDNGAEAPQGEGTTPDAPESEEAPALEPETAAGAPPAAEKPPEPAAAAPPPAEEAGAAAEEAEVAEEEPPPPPNPIVERLRAQFPDVQDEGQDAGGDPIVRVAADRLLEVMEWLRDDEVTAFEYLMDLTAVDWTVRTPRFDVVYHLYSIPKNHKLTVKTGCPEDEGVPSVSELWGTANWHERECYDLYGIEFLGHPNLERIFLPEDWEGFPLRKDYPLEGPNLELITRQQAAFRGGRFDRIRGDYEMTEVERQLAGPGVVGSLWTPAPETEAAASEPEGGEHSDE